MNDSHDEANEATAEIGLYLACVAEWGHSAGLCSCNTCIKRPFTYYLHLLATDDASLSSFVLWMLDTGHWKAGMPVDLDAIKELMAYLRDNIIQL